MAIISALLAVSCEKKVVSTYSEQYLVDHLISGTSMPAVEIACGQPSLLRVTKDGKKMAIYERPSREMPSSYKGKLSGFIIYYTNDVLEYWTPTYSDQTIMSATLQTNNATNAKPATEANRPLLDPVGRGSDLILFYVANPQEAKAIESKSILSRTPDLQITGIEQVSKVLFRGGGTNQQNGLVVALGKSNTEGLRKLTAENLGSRLVIAIGGEIVASSYLIAPIENGSFSFPCGTQEECDRILAKLQTFSGASK